MNGSTPSGPSNSMSGGVTFPPSASASAAYVPPHAIAFVDNSRCFTDKEIGEIFLFNTLLQIKYQAQPQSVGGPLATHAGPGGGGRRQCHGGVTRL